MNRPSTLSPAATGSSDAPAGLAAQGLRVALAGRAVLHSIDVALRPGWTAIVGPNGAGKSTLLRAFAGLLDPERGRVTLGARELRSIPPASRARELAWLAQQSPCTGELTVRETVELGRIAHLGLLGTPGPADRAAVERAMARTGCERWAERQLDALSGGERQRVLLARALATEAPWLLLDEPTTHLDPAHQVALARLFRDLADEAGATRGVVTVLHELSIALLADRVLVLDRGHLVADGEPRDPALHAALSAAFGGAIVVEPGATPRVAFSLSCA